MLLATGKGSYIKAKDGSVYEGEWQHDQRSGYGTLAVPQNDEKDPKKNLKTKELRKLYAGEWYQNEFSGRGTYYFEDGTHYEGEWKSNKQNGWGTRYYADGSRYDGEWKNGKRHGQGVLLLRTFHRLSHHVNQSSTIANHDKYEGMWMNDMKEGPGRFYYRSKNQVYQGEWALDIPKCGALSAVPFSKQVLQQSLNSGNYTASPLDLPYVRSFMPNVFFVMGDLARIGGSRICAASRTRRAHE